MAVPLPQQGRIVLFASQSHYVTKSEILDTTLISLKYQVCRSSSQACEVKCQIKPATISDKSSKLGQRENGIKTKPLGSGRQKQQDEDSVLQIQVSGIIKFPLWPLQIQTQTHHEKVVLDSLRLIYLMSGQHRLSSICTLHQYQGKMRKNPIFSCNLSSTSF